jgi:hypothetical protein
VPIVGVINRRDETGSAPQAESDVQATLAHEVFHCYQARHFADQLARVPEASWWVESTAEFVAETVYPCNRSALWHSERFVADDTVPREPPPAL